MTQVHCLKHLWKRYLWMAVTWRQWESGCEKGRTWSSIRWNPDVTIRVNEPRPMKLLQHLFTAPLHGLHKSTRAYFTEHICSKFPKEKLAFRSYFLFLHHFSVIYKEYLTGVCLLFYLFSQQNIGIER